MPATLIAKPPEENTAITVPFVSDLRHNLRTAHEKVRENTKRFAKVEKRYYDNKIKPDNLQVGQKVWLFWPKPQEQSKFRKLYKMWTGPWTIIKFKTPLVVEIEHVAKKTRHAKLSRQTVHVDRLTPCRIEVEAETGATDVEPEEETQPVEDTQPDSQAETQDLFSHIGLVLGRSRLRKWYGCIPAIRYDRTLLLE